MYRANGQVQRSKFPHSWRVEVLPFVEEAALYQKYHFDEPWDSKANKAEQIAPLKGRIERRGWHNRPRGCDLI